MSTQIEGRISSGPLNGDGMRRKQLEALLDVSAMAIWVTGPEGEVREDIPSWRALTGQSEAEVKGYGWMNAVHPDDKKEVKRAWEHAAKTKSSYHVEYRVRDRHGAWRWSEARGTPILTPGGSIKEWVGLNIDVSERKIAEEALQRSEARLRAILDYAPVGIAVANAQGRLEYLNRESVAIWGGAKHVAAANFDQYEGWFVESGKRIAAHEWALSRALQNNEVSTGEKLRIRSFDGEEKFVLNSAAPICAPNGTLLGAVAVIQEITALVRAEEQLRKTTEQLALAIKSARVGFYDWDLQTNQAVFSEQMKKDWGIDSATRLETAEDAFALMHPEDVGHVRELIEKAIHDRTPYYAEYRVVHSDGQIVWVQVTGDVIYDAQNTPTRFFGTSVEITERKEAEENLKRMSALLNTIMETSSDIIYMKDRQSHMQYCNPMALKLIGTSEVEIYGKNDVEFLGSGHGGEAILQTDDRIMSTGKSETVEEWVTWRDGSRRLYMSRKEPHRDEHGNVIGLIGISTDITEYKLTSEALRASEDRFTKVVENMSEGLMLFDPEGNLIYQNPASLSIHGFEPEKDGRIPHSEVPATWEAWDENGRPITFAEWPVSRVFRLERFKNQVLHVRRVETGHEFYGSYNGSPILDENNRLRLGFITIRDITEQVAASARVKEREAMFRSYAEAMPQMAFIADAEGNIIYFNKRHFEYFGVTQGETEGWAWKDKPVHHPDDVERTVATWTYSLKTGEPYEIEYRLRRHDGQYRWHLGRAVAIRDSKGKITSWVGTNTDIQEQKETQERINQLQLETEAARRELHEFFMQAPAPLVVLLGPDHRFYLANPPYEVLVGQKVMGKTAKEAFSREAADIFIPLLDRVYLTGEPYTGNELPFGEKFISIGYHPFRQANGAVKGVLALVIDVTEQVLARRSIEQLAKDLQMAVHARDEFLSIASHELKTPISTLKIQSQSAKRLKERGDPAVYKPERVNKLIDQTDKQVERIAKLVENMLDISRIRAGKLVLQKEPLALCKLVEEVVERLGPMLREAGTPVSCVCSGSLSSISVEGDRGRLEQVITNLLTNAMRYGNRQPVSVQMGRAKEDPSKLRIVVQDQGIGITPEERNRVFERFERLVDANEVSGLGLGLFITKQIVEAHGGRIWVESEGLGKGASFFVELPLTP